MPEWDKAASSGLLSSGQPGLFVVTGGLVSDSAEVTSSQAPGACCQHAIELGVGTTGSSKRERVEAKDTGLPPIIFHWHNRYHCRADA